MSTSPACMTRWFARLGDRDGELIVEFRTHYEQPGCWGVVLADIAHHVASAYCQASGTFDPRPIVREIIEIMNKEIRNPKTSRQCFMGQREPVRPDRRAAGGEGTP